MASPLEQLRDLVETSIESDDVGPLVKAVFEVQPPGEAMPPPLRGAGATSESAATTSLADGQLPAGTSPLDAVLEMLGEVAEEKEAEIAQICRANTTEISSAMHELGALQQHTGSLRQQLLANNGELQAAGAAFAARLEEVQEVTALQQGVADARKAVGAALAVLRLCARAAQLIDSKQLYKAYKTLEVIQRDHGTLLRGGYSAEARPLLPSNAAAAGGGGMAAQVGGAAAGTGGAAGGKAGSREGTPLKAAPNNAAGRAGSNSGPAEQLGPLAAFLRERVAELAVSLEQRALADFHNWLSNVRAQARTIGLRAVRWAASQRQQEEQLTRQRKLLLPRLDGLQDIRAAGALVAQTLRAPGSREAPPVTPLQLPPPVAGSPAPAAAAAAGEPGSGSSTPPGSAGCSSASPTAAFRAARRAAGGSPTRLGSEAAAAADAASGRAGAAAVGGAAAGVTASPPGTAASSSRAAAAAGGEARTPVNPALARMQHGRQVQRADTFQITGDLLDGVDMAPLHRCLHIHACLGRLPQFAEYYAENRRQQLAADLALHGSGDFLEHYQAYLTQLVGFFLVEDAVQRQAGGSADQGLDVVAQVDAAWDAAVAALKRVLEPAFSGATAAAQMLTVKDFLLLSCLALDHCGYQTVAIREMLVSSRPKYFELLGDATQAAVKMAVSKDGLSPVEVRGSAEVEQLFRQLALPVTFRAEDAGNKRPPFRAPFSPMVPELVRIVRGHVVDSVAYLKGLLTAGEVASAARQAPDRQLTRILTEALQQRVDAAAGDRDLPATTALQLVANIASLIHAMAPLEEFALGQARGDTAEIVAAAAAAAAEQAAQRSRSPSPGRRSRSRSRSPGKSGLGGDVDQLPEEETRGRQPAATGAEGETAAAAAAAGEGGSGRPKRGGSQDSRVSSHASAPSPPRSPSPAPAGAQAASGSQQTAHPPAAPTASQLSALSGHTVHSFTTSAVHSGSAAAAVAGAGGSAAAFEALLESAEALAVQVIAAKAAPLLAASTQLNWAPSEQARSTAYSPHIDELIMYLKECASLVTRLAPGPSVARMLRSLLRYLGDAFMLQLLSDAIPEFNIFGLQRLFNDLGGISRAAGSMAVPGLADELAEPLLFCEMMVFGSLEDLLRPELRASPKYACLDLGRVARVLDKYAELDKASGYRSMHKSKQAERFISRKTVDKVLKELREAAGGGSRPGSRGASGSFSGSLSAGHSGPSGSGLAGGGVRPSGSVTAERR